MHRRSVAASVLLPFALAACAPRRPAQSSTSADQAQGSGAAARPVGRPLAALAGERVALLPAQRVRVVDSAVSAPTTGAAGAVALEALDGAIAASVGGRGIQWAFAEEILRSARRNPTHAADPRRLAVGELLSGRRPSADGAIGDPLASQLRTLVALNDARYALVPAELRVERVSAGTARAVLRVALVDARAAQLRWAGDVVGDPAPVSAVPLSPAAAAILADRLADLIAAP